MTTTGNQLASRNQAFAEGADHFETKLSGVLSMKENVPSALSLGLNPDDPRTQTFQGQRFVMTSPNGRSQSTSLAQPQFEQAETP